MEKVTDQLIRIEGSWSVWTENGWKEIVDKPIPIWDQEKLEKALPGNEDIRWSDPYIPPFSPDHMNILPKINPYSVVFLLGYLFSLACFTVVLFLIFGK